MQTRRVAFDALVSAYWRPVYKYVRIKWRADRDDAADLTQEFFARAFEKGSLGRFDPREARFRTFLRVCLDGFVANEHKAAGTTQTRRRRVVRAARFRGGGARARDAP